MTVFGVAPAISVTLTSMTGSDNMVGEDVTTIFLEKIASSIEEYKRENSVLLA